MTAKDINNALYVHFDNYEHKLNNTVVFDWESDFFAQSKSGYFIECEVKISRGDFYKDFKKPKHRLFMDASCGKKHHITPGEESSWDYSDYPMQHNILGDADWYQLLTTYGDFGRERRRGEQTMVSHGGPYVPWKRGIKNGKPGFWVNDYGDVQLVKHTVTLRAKFCRVTIQEIEKMNVPNQFYYAVPKGLVKLEEIPKYAGLLVVNEHGNIECVRRAPYLHKRSMNLDKILLKKYYNLWRFKVPYETKVAIRNNI